MNLQIKPLTRSNTEDFFDFFDNRAFTDNSPYAPCYCSCFQLTPDEVRVNIAARAKELGGGFEGLRLALRESARHLIDAGKMRGYLAYLDGQSVGWCNANDKQSYLRVGSFNPGKRRDEDYFIVPGERGVVKSVVCFEIAPEHRGKGIARSLLARICEDAREDGYKIVEGYATASESFSALDFTGPLAMYRNAGFVETSQHGKLIVMQRTVGSRDAVGLVL